MDTTQRGGEKNHRVSKQFGKTGFVGPEAIFIFIFLIYNSGPVAIFNSH